MARKNDDGGGREKEWDKQKKGQEEQGPEGIKGPD